MVPAVSGFNCFISHDGYIIAPMYPEHQHIAPQRERTGFGDGVDAHDDETPHCKTSWLEQIWGRSWLDCCATVATGPALGTRA